MRYERSNVTDDAQAASMDNYAQDYNQGRSS